MIGRVLQLIIGVIVFLCSTPAGMAQKVILEESRAVYFAESDFSDDDRQSVLPLEDLTMIPASEITVEQEDCAGGAKQVRRGHKRHNSHARRLSGCIPSKAFFVERATERAARHPLRQDARQERTKTIRFLHLASLAC